MDNPYTRSKPMEIPEEALKQTLEDNQTEGFGGGLLAFAERAPFVAAGIVGCGIVCGVGAYKWRSRTIPPQMFLTQLRVIAQTTALGCITLGLVHQMYKDYISRQKPNDSSTT